MKEYEDALKFWDEAIAKYEPQKVEDNLSVSAEFDQLMDEFLSHCEKILDYGSGSADLSFMALQRKSTLKITGLEQSKNMITYAKGTAALSGFESRIQFVQGDEKALGKLKDGEYDGVIISNVLDVIPKEVSDEILSQLARIVKKDGYVFLKLNEYIDSEENAKKYNLIKFQDNMYQKGGVLRVRNCDTDEWKACFNKNFNLIAYQDVPYQSPDCLDRLFLLQRK